MRYVFNLDEKHGAGFTLPIDDEDAVVVNGNLFIPPAIRMQSFGYFVFSVVDHYQIPGRTLDKAIVMSFYPVVTWIPVASNISMTAETFGQFYWEQQQQTLIYRLLGGHPASVFSTLAGLGALLGHPVTFDYYTFDNQKHLLIIPATAHISVSLKNNSVIPTIVEYADILKQTNIPSSPIRSPSFLKASALSLLNGLNGVTSKDESPYKTELYYQLSPYNVDLHTFDIREINEQMPLPGAARTNPVSELMNMIQKDVRLADVYPFYFYTSIGKNIEIQYIGSVLTDQLKHFKNMLSDTVSKLSEKIGNLSQNSMQSTFNLQQQSEEMTYVDVTKLLSGTKRIGRLFHQLFPEMFFLTMIGEAPTSYKVYTYFKNAFFMPLFPIDANVKLVSRPLPEEFKEFYQMEGEDTEE